MIYVVTRKKVSEYPIVSIEYLLKYFKGKAVIQIDTETEHNKRNKDSLPNPYEARLLSVQLGDRYNQFVIDADEFDMNSIKPLLEDAKVVKIFTNAFFDLRFFFHFGINVKNVYDCFLAELILNRGKVNEKGYLGLAAMASRYANGTLNKEIRGQIHWRGLDATVIKYAAEDVKYMEDIRDAQIKRLEQDGMLRYLNLENKHIITLARISYNGFMVDRDKWIQYAKYNEERLEQYAKKLGEYVVKNKLNKYIDQQMDIFSSDLKCTINWRSSQQVIPLFEDLGIDVMVRDRENGGMKKSVDSKHLARQQNKFDILPLYLKYKEIEKEYSTYGQEFIDLHYNPITGRIHSEFFPILNTGRISSSNPNMQNIPAIDDEGGPHPLRKCFHADKGNVIIVCDFSQQEPRITADKCKDPLLTELFLNGDGDTHSLVATAISPFFFGKEIKVDKHNNPMIEGRGKRIRDLGKIINLKLDYGGSAFTLKDDLDCSKEEAQKIIDLILNKFVKKEEYFKSCRQFIEQNGYVITDRITNARSYYNGYKDYMDLKAIPYSNKTQEQISRMAKMRGEMHRMAQNFPIQGTAGVMTKTALILFDEAVGNSAKIVAQVHDEIVVECSEESADFIAETLRKCMVAAGNIFCKTIPMKVDPAIGPDWGCK